MATSPAATGRRTVLRGAAWTVPVVAVTAPVPAFATSTSCSPVSAVFDWNQGTTGVSVYTRTSPSTGGSGTYDPTGATGPISFTVSTSFTNGLIPNDVGGTNDDNMRVTNLNVGGTGQRGFAICQQYPPDTPSNPGGSQTVTFTFNRTISGLSFKITDIDSGGGAFKDTVSISSPTATFTGGIVNTSALAGSGTAADPWTPTSNSAGVNDGSGTAGNVNVSTTGSLTQFTIVYRNTAPSWSLTSLHVQYIWLTDLNFTYTPATC